MTWRLAVIWEPAGRHYRQQRKLTSRARALARNLLDTGEEKRGRWRKHVLFVAGGSSEMPGDGLGWGAGGAAAAAAAAAAKRGVGGNGPS